MMEIIANGVAISLAAYVVIMKLGIRRLLSNSLNLGGVHISVEAAIDLGFTALLFFAFQGTYGGTMSAIIGGLVLSFLLFITKLKSYQIALIIIVILITGVIIYDNFN